MGEGSIRCWTALFDRLYRAGRATTASERERAEHALVLYERGRAPLVAGAAVKLSLVRPGRATMRVMLPASRVIGPPLETKVGCAASGPLLASRLGMRGELLPWPDRPGGTPQHEPH